MATIEIKGVIGKEYLYSDFITAYAAAKDEPIRLYIDSVGGDVYQGQQIADFIKSHEANFLSVTNSGDVASIASNIFLALPFAKRFFNMSKGIPLIHNPFYEELNGVQLTADALDYYSEDIRKTQEDIAKFITAQTGANKDVVSALMQINEPLTESQLTSINFANIVKFQAIAFINKNKENEMKKEEVQEMLSQNNISLIDKIMAVFKPKVVALMLTDSVGGMVEFPDVADGATPVIGDTAKLADGTPANGEVLMATGETYVFEAGVLTEIKAVETENEDVTIELEALKTELEAAKLELAAVQAKNNEIAAIKAQLASIKSEMTVEKPTEVPTTAPSEKQSRKLSEILKK
jgi:ATP-dependent protease ClpP protease subunit